MFKQIPYYDNFFCLANFIIKTSSIVCISSNTKFKGIQKILINNTAFDLIPELSLEAFI